MNHSRPPGWTSADAAGLPILPGLLRHGLKAGFSLAGYTGDALVILTAMKRYGLMLADQGSAWYVTGTSDPGWADALEQLRRAPVSGGDFEVVASGPPTAC